MSHAWECSFAGLIEAIAGLPSEAFAWCDVITINQHHAAKEEPADDNAAPLSETRQEAAGGGRQ